MLIPAEDPFESQQVQDRYFLYHRSKNVVSLEHGSACRGNNLMSGFHLILLVQLLLFFKLYVSWNKKRPALLSVFAFQVFPMYGARAKIYHSTKGGVEVVDQMFAT